MPSFGGYIIPIPPFTFEPEKSTEPNLLRLRGFINSKTLALRSHKIHVANPTWIAAANSSPSLILPWAFLENTSKTLQWLHQLVIIPFFLPASLVFNFFLQQEWIWNLGRLASTRNPSSSMFVGGRKLTASNSFWFWYRLLPPETFATTIVLAASILKPDKSLTHRTQQFTTLEVGIENCTSLGFLNRSVQWVNMWR